MPDENVESGSQIDTGAVDGRGATGSNGVRPPVKRGPDPAIAARNAMLDDIEARITAQRQAETKEVLEGGDEQARAFLARAARERGESLEETFGSQADEGSSETADVEGATDGSELDPEDAQVGDSAAEEAARATKVDARGNDPLTEFVVVRNGKPMFKTKVDGKEQLVPLESARAQLQKHLAADLRLQDIAKQRRELDQRARNIQSAETALRVRSQSQPSAPSAAVDDQALEREAFEVVSSLVNKPEAEAAQKLAGVLKKIRQAAPPPIDSSTIVQQAATLAVNTVVARDQQKALTAGLTAFKRDYADVAADPDLYAMADRRTDAIAEEHPDWTPTLVMLEAGKQTRAWLAAKSGRPVAKLNPDSGRQQRKDNLRPMPAARTARVAQATETQVDNSPQAALAEARKARGQFA